MIIDASVAVKWVATEEGADRAAELRHQTLSAPSLFIAECANALASKVRRKQMSSEEAATGLRLISRAGVTLTEMSALADDALVIAVDLGHPVYDCFYLASAKRVREQVATFDARFARVVRGTAYEASVLYLGD